MEIWRFLSDEQTFVRFKNFFNFICAIDCGKMVYIGLNKSLHYGKEEKRVIKKEGGKNGFVHPDPGGLKIVRHIRKSHFWRNQSRNKLIVH